MKKRFAEERPNSPLMELCVPLEQAGMRAVGDAVNDARHDEPDCLEHALPRLTLF